MTDTLDLDAEIALLEARKEKLQRLHALRLECAALEGKRPLPNTISELAKIVARHRRINVECLYSSRREQFEVESRAIVYLLARKHTSATFTMIGKVFNRDHGTVLNGLQMARNLMDTEPKFAQVVGLCEAEFLSARPEAEE